MVHIDSADNKSIDLKCGDYAETLSLIETQHVSNRDEYALARVQNEDAP
jgi:hypothetical protein